MNIERKPLYVVRLYGFLFFAFGLFGLGFHACAGSLFDMVGLTFVFIMTALHLVIGLGLMKRDRVGLLLLRLYLRVFSLAYPIGTNISKKSLAYLEDNNIDQYFK